MSVSDHIYVRLEAVHGGNQFIHRFAVPPCSHSISFEKMYDSEMYDSEKEPMSVNSTVRTVRSIHLKEKAWFSCIGRIYEERL